MPTPGPHTREAGAGPGVVCLHSNASHSGQWRELMDRLSPDFHVLAPDSHGAGKGPAWPADRALRLRTPLLRHRKRGEEAWVEVTWDEALGYVADRMQRIKAEHGPEAMALFSHGIGGTFLKHTLHWCRVAGSAASGKALNFSTRHLALLALVVLAS